MNSKGLASYINQHIADQDLSTKIASYLVDNKLTLDLESIMRDVMVAREKNGIFEVSLTTAHAISQTQEQAIIDFIKQVIPEAKEVILDKNVEPALLGGFRIESANYLIDRSLKAKLNYIKSTIEI